jgi:hypothetical protein
MKFGIFERVTDYSKMLIRIMVSTFVLSVLALWFLRTRIPQLDAAIAAHFPTLTIKVLDLPVSFGTLLPAGAITVLFRVFRVHDRISDLLGIRRRFDVKYILKPLAVGSTGEVSAEQLKKIRSKRDDLMYKVFYKYASSKSPAIDAHFIEDALDWWGWYWCMLEAICVALISASLAGWYRHWRLSAAFAIAAVLALVGAILIKRRCTRCAQREVSEILSDNGRVREIEPQFSAL